eukprot:gene213-281_t
MRHIFLAIETTLPVNFLKDHEWLFEVVAIVLGAAVATYSVHLLYQKLSRSGQGNTHILFKTLLKALYWPLIILIWIETLSISVHCIPYADITLVNIVDKIRKPSLLGLLALLLTRFANLFEDQLLRGSFKKRATNKNVIQVTGKLLRVVSFSIFALFLLPSIGINITGILAFVSGSTFVLGIAAQHIIANYLGGIVVHSDGHFKVGDWIYLAEKKEAEGIVEYIGWRSTHIRTFDRKLLYIPNAIFSNHIVVNASKMTNRNIKETFHIRPEDAPLVTTILEKVNTMLENHPDLDKSRRLALHAIGLSHFSIKLELYAFTSSTDWTIYRNIQQRLLLDILHIIHTQGAKIATAPMHLDATIK